MDEQEGFLSGLDDFWLRVEHPRRLMTVSGLWMFEKRLDSRRVYQSINELCDRFPRYAMVPANASLINTAEWTPARGWEPRMNVMHHQLKEPTEQALQDYVADQISRPFVYSKPLWELHAISGLDGERCAFFWKAHHCLADGYSFISSLWDITHRSADGGKELHSSDEDDNHHNRHHKFHDHEKTDNSNNDKYAAGSPRRKKQQQYRRHDSIPDPIWLLLPHWLQCVIALCIEGQALLRTLIHDFWVFLYCILPRRWSHHHDLYYDGLQAFRKQIAWSEPIRIKDIRLVQRALGQGAINDIMVLVVTRCIKDYLEQQNLRKDKHVCLLIPMSQRSRDDCSFQNIVSATWGWFSMEEISTKTLFRQVWREMLAIKASKMPSLMYEWFAQRVLARVPGLVNLMNRSVDRLADIPHAVLTNLPGPTRPVVFGGQAISDFRVLPPQSGKGCLAIGLVSYNGKINISVLADEHPKYPRLAASICEQFAPEFELLVREACMDLTRH